MFILTVSVLFLMIHQGQCALKATAVLYGDNSATFYGSLTFNQDGADAPVRITGEILGLNASSAHGFHVHTNGVSDGSPNCTAAAGHFNPYNTLHGPPTANITSRHVGDLGNITTDASGVAIIDMEDWIIQLYNATQSILNRTVVVHLLRDDGGESGAPDSTTTGNAGARILCGLIKLSPDDVTTTTITTPQTSTGTTSQSSTVTTSQPSTGFNLQPVISVLLFTMIIDYVIHF